MTSPAHCIIAKLICPADEATPAWQPQTSAEQEIDVLSRLRIKKIEARKGTPRNFSLVDGLRNSWFGSLYMHYLKKVAPVRSFFRWGWYQTSPLIMRFMGAFILYGDMGRWRALVSLKNYAAKHGCPIYKLADPGQVQTPMPGIYPAGCSDYFRPKIASYMFPEIYVTQVTTALVCGGTNFVRVGEDVICHDLYDFKYDSTSEELNAHAAIDPRRSRIRILSHDLIPEKLDRAACFTDSCSNNYAHWMTEVLTRIAVFCADERFKDIPLIVDAGLHDNIMQSLLYVAGTEREIITISSWRAVEVAELYVTSVAGYVPFWRRIKSSRQWSGIFSPYAIQLVRDKLIAEAMRVYGGGDWPEKICIRRVSSVRKLTNLSEVDRLMTQQGFALIEPERLSLLQQVRLFSQAKAVAGSSGAALGNIIFLDPAARLFVMMSKQHNNIYWYWQNMACAAGNKICYILGEIDGHKNDGIHADFKIDPADLTAALERERAL